MTLTHSLPDQKYWTADPYAREAVAQFSAAHGAHNVAKMRHVFFEGATLYTRSLDILARSVQNRRPHLADAAATNLITLHRALARMHRLAPAIVSLPIAARDAERERMVQDLVVSALEAAGRSLRVTQLEKRVAEWDLLGEGPPHRLQEALATLVDHGSLVQEGDRWRLTGVALHPLNLDHEGLRAMLPAGEYDRLSALGFTGISEVAARAARFREVARERLAWEEGLGDAIARACVVIDSYSGAFPAGVEHSDLIHSQIPRPYQYEAFAVFRGSGYAGQVVEAPTGSGKTLIGMMCIQDWLARLTEGERILILVPSQNYQRQWVRELCYLPTGLQIPPESVWAGSPAGLNGHTGRRPVAPVVLVMTYAALADIAARDVHAGDAAGLEACPGIRNFIEAHEIRHVLLDEVHKVAQRPGSPTALLGRALADWNRSGAVRSLIGFSGTAEVYQERLKQLGLEFVFKVPAVDTVAHGFVAPFGELAIPFAYSEREKQVHDALDAYKGSLRGLLAAVGAAALRSGWAGIPLERRIAAVHALHPDATERDDEAITARVVAAERTSDPVTLRDIWMVALLQGLEGLSDEALAERALDPATALSCIADCRKVARTVQEMVRLPSLSFRLGRLESLEVSHTPEGQGGCPDISTVMDMIGPRTARGVALRDALAVTVCGAALSFAEWYRQTGEGRVGAIRAALEAEQRTRVFHGAIIFDAGRSIPWRHRLPAPGFAGVGGTFAEFIRDPLPGVTPFAALSGEFYLPLDPPGLPERIAEFIRDRIMVDEVGTEIVEMATRGLALHPDAHSRVEEAIRAGLRTHADAPPRGRGVRRAREFRRAVLTPLRLSLGGLGLGRVRERIARRLTARNPHLASLIAAFYSYAATAELFRHAAPREWIGTDGVRRSCAVVALPAGPRRQLMYEMASRIPDAPELGINVVLVSAWARTGWNVRQPNVLIDATATRNPTAWQQLRGRAMRALPEWSPNCGRAAALLTREKPHSPGTHAPDGGALSSDVDQAWRSLQVAEAGRPDAEVLRLLESVLDAGETELLDLIRAGMPDSWTPAQRAEILVRLLHRHNKVTHVYELLKSCGSSQVIKTDGRWNRRPALELKHAREDSVNPLTGEYGAGVGHAPLVYASDPRSDLPADLEEALVADLKGADEKIILGWVRAAGLF
jgi:superfamily II DNA or RNA helicase